MSFATVIIPHCRSPRWLQICLASLKACKNDTPFDIWVIDNSQGHDSIKAIDNELGESVEIRTIPIEAMRTPALALDYAIDYVNTPWLFAAETDIRFVRDGWLDWYRSHMRDDHVGMVGWYWELSPSEDDTRHYIAPSATLYNMEMLRILKAECIANKQLTVSYGPAYSLRRPVRDTGNVEQLIMDGHWGPFAERRGFVNSYPVRKRYEQFWHDTGSWLFYRAEHQWECVRVPGKWVKQAPTMQPPVKYTYIGPTEPDCYIIHYWAGTVSHDFEKHEVGGWAADCVEWWLRREYRLWLSTVPESARDDAISRGIIPNFEEELAYARSRIRKA